MTTAFANPDDLNLRSYVTYSLVLHTLLIVAWPNAFVFERLADTRVGVGHNGQGGGDFGVRYPRYVDSVSARDHKAWDQIYIETGVSGARRAHTVMTFRINADGRTSNIRLFQTSGTQSMAYSAQRAL